MLQCFALRSCQGNNALPTVAIHCRLLLHCRTTNSQPVHSLPCLLPQVEFNKAALSLADAFPADQKKAALNRLLKVRTVLSGSGGGVPGPL